MSDLSKALGLDRLTGAITFGGKIIGIVKQVEMDLPTLEQEAIDIGKRGADVVARFEAALANPLTALADIAPIKDDVVAIIHDGQAIAALFHLHAVSASNNPPVSRAAGPITQPIPVVPVSAPPVHPIPADNGQSVEADTFESPLDQQGPSPQ